jgi:hypothetical protein
MSLLNQEHFLIPNVREDNIMTTKTPNYTQAQTDMMVARYIAVASEPEATRDAVVQEIAIELKKNVRSVRAKLSRENVYVAKVPKAKDGSTVIRKDQLARILSDQVGFPLDSAVSMTKNDLKRVIICIRDLREQLAVFTEVEDEATEE